MADLRKAAQMALEALENHEGNYKLGRAGCERQEAAITAIKEALAQPPLPVQEPPQYSFKAHWTDDKRIGVVACVTRPDGGVHLLQTSIDSPSEQRQPLTDEASWEIWHRMPKDGAITVSAFARAIEAKLKERNT